MEYNAARAIVKALRFAEGGLQTTCREGVIKNLASAQRSLEAALIGSLGPTVRSSGWDADMAADMAASFEAGADAALSGSGSVDEELPMKSMAEAVSSGPASAPEAPPCP